MKCFIIRYLDQHRLRTKWERKINKQLKALTKYIYQPHYKGTDFRNP